MLPKCRSWRSPLMPRMATRSVSATPGAEAYVSKPISVMKFAQTVDELLHAPIGKRASPRRPRPSTSPAAEETAEANKPGRRGEDQDPDEIPGRGGSRIKSGMRSLTARYLILASLNSTCLRATRVVLLEAQLLSLRARILLRHVEEARVRGADELDLDRCRLGHCLIPILSKRKAARRRSHFDALMTSRADFVNRHSGVTAV